MAKHIGSISTGSDISGKLIHLSTFCGRWGCNGLNNTCMLVQMQIGTEVVVLNQSSFDALLLGLKKANQHISEYE